MYVCMHVSDSKPLLLIDNRVNRPFNKDSALGPRLDIKGLAGSIHSLWFHIIALQLIKLLSLKEYIRIPLEKKATYFEKKGYVVS